MCAFAFRSPQNPSQLDNATRAPQLEDKVERVSKKDAASHWASERRSACSHCTCFQILTIALKPAIVWVQETLNSSASYEVSMDLDGFHWISVSKLNDWSSCQALFDSEILSFPGPSKTLPFHQPGFVPGGWLTRPVKSGDGRMMENYFQFVFSFHGTIPWPMAPLPFISIVKGLFEQNWCWLLMLEFDFSRYFYSFRYWMKNVGNPKTPGTTKSTHPGALMVWQLVTQGTIPQCQRRDASLPRSHWSLPLWLWVFSVSTRISQSLSCTADASPDLISIYQHSFRKFCDHRRSRKYDKILENMRKWKEMSLLSYLLMFLFCCFFNCSALFGCCGGFCIPNHDAFWSFFAPKGFEQRNGAPIWRCLAV